MTEEAPVDDLDTALDGDLRTAIELASLAPSMRGGHGSAAPTGRRRAPEQTVTIPPAGH